MVHAAWKVLSHGSLNCFLNLSDDVLSSLDEYLAQRLLTLRYIWVYLRSPEMKIEELVKDLKGLKSEEKIYNYVIQHPDEVYGYRYNDDADKNLQAAFPEFNPDTIDWYLWDLEREKRIGKIKIGRRVYLGSHEAIEELRKKIAKRE